MIERGALRVHRVRVDQRTDLAKRGRQVAVVLATHRHVASAGCVQTQDHPHRGGLARTVRAEEPGHQPRPDGEAQVIDGRGRAVALGEVARFDLLAFWFAIVPALRGIAEHFRFYS